MKRTFILCALLVLTVLSFGQDRYKYVIIPTFAADIGQGMNPNQVCSSMQKSLTKRSIPCQFEGAERTVDYCDALRVNFEKGQSLLRNKIVLHFVDCMNRVIFSMEGTGMSKDFPEGYAEAIEDALADFSQLPIKKYDVPAAPVAVAATTPVVAAPVADATKADYTPTEIWFNEKYLVDYVKDEQGKIKLIILNGREQGYKKLEQIAQLEPSDIAGIYSVQWTQPNGKVWSGVGQGSDSQLTISVSAGENKEVIILQKK